MSDKPNQIAPERFGPDDSFIFSCSKELECFNLCCRDINLFLTPYDIVRMKRRLGISSHEFLKTYTFPLFREEIGHPVILLRMLTDQSKSCPFVSDDGCMIYDDRPWSCRSFPLEPIAESVPPAFGIIRRDFCRGFDKGRSHTIKKWRDAQNVGFYEGMNEAWKQVTHHKNFGSSNLLEGPPRDMFFLASYNIDEFRNVVFHGDLLNYFEVDKKVLKDIKSSEAELLKFAFLWLRNVLFGDDTLRRK